MTKKHFKVLASFIKDAKQYCGDPFTEKQIDYLASYCRSMAKNTFDGDKFREACGVSKLAPGTEFIVNSNRTMSPVE